MPLSDVHILKTKVFNHKNIDYKVSAFTKCSSLQQIIIKVTYNNQPVIITYPDGFQATLGYYIDLETCCDIANATGINAIDALMITAENDIRKLL